jgi:cytidylate kinase
MRIVLLGPPGAGKGTQALLITKKYDIPHISTGEILREQVALGSPLGLRVKAVLDAGELVAEPPVILSAEPAPEAPGSTQVVEYVITVGVELLSTDAFNWIYCPVYGEVSAY